jgi:hypothetical protein
MTNSIISLNALELQVAVKSIVNGLSLIWALVYLCRFRAGNSTDIRGSYAALACLMCLLPSLRQFHPESHCREAILCGANGGALVLGAN